jgi:serpin B
MALISVVHFKGRWSRPFEGWNKPEIKFTRADGSESTVPALYDDGWYRIQESESARILELNFGKKGEASAFFILPKPGKTTAEYLREASFTLPGDLSKTSTLEHKECIIQVPKFTFSYDRELTDDLRDLGLKIAFSPSADFSLMSNESLKISMVKQKAFVALNEDGVEAAAAEYMGMEAGAAPGYDEPTQCHFDLDRPFVFAIRDNKSRTLLFVGTVQNPQ